MDEIAVVATIVTVAITESSVAPGPAHAAPELGVLQAGRGGTPPRRARTSAHSPETRKAPMSPVLTRHAPEPVRDLRRVAAPIALIVAVLALFAVLLDLVADAATVERVSIENRAEMQVEVGIAGARGGVQWLAAVEPGTRAVVTDVLDQGETWIVRAEHAGVPIGEQRLTREELGHRAWRIVIPAEWGDEPRR